MNETIASLLHRRSIRKYTAEPVKLEDLELIANCGQYAATGMGRQAWHITIVTDREYLDAVTEGNRAAMLSSPDEMPRKLASAPDFDAWRGAPVAIVVSGDKNDLGSYGDCAAVAQNMAVAAYSLGLGSCILGSFKICMETGGRPDLVEKLGAPEGYVPLFALAVGHADESPVAAPRKEGAISHL